MRDCVCGSHVAVDAEWSYSKDVYNYQRVSSNSVRNIILATMITLPRAFTRTVFIAIVYAQSVKDSSANS
jgi:hypothetical protein